MHGFRAYQLTVAACELRIPDLLAAGPHTSTSLAEATGTHEPSLRRLLRGLAAWGVVSEEPGGMYAATPISEAFRSDRPGLRNMTILLRREGYQAWAELLFTLRTGKPAFDHVFGKTRFEALADDPEEAARFNAAMVEMTARVGGAFVAAYDFINVGTVVDVGGGNGALLTAILQAHPRMRGVLFDLPQGLAGARERLESGGVAGRVTLAQGSFFDSVPPGGDLYLLKSVLHDWDDEHALEIVKTCRAGMSDGARLVVLERTLPERIDGSRSALNAVMADLQMMVVLGGRERTTAEYSDLFSAAGLRLTRFVPGDSEWGFLEAFPA